MQNNTKYPRLRFDISYLPLVIGAVLTVAVIYVIYNQSQAILKDRLKERVDAIVSTAALQFDGDDIEKIINDEQKIETILTPIESGATIKFDQKEIENEILSNPVITGNPILPVTKKMKAIRDANTNIRYIYIWRKTDNENILKFVTDADTLIPVDWDKNGKIDDIEYPPMPGEDYDISDIPLVKNEAFDHSVVQDDFIVDKWGTFLSGFAPIRDRNDKVVAIIGMDIQIDDFFKVIRATLLPFILLAVMLLLLLSFQTLTIVRIWKNRVDLVKDLDRQKDELLSIVSHQLAAPITAIKWYLELLQDDTTGSEKTEYFGTMQGITANLSDLVSMLLDVSRIQLGKMKPDKKEIALAEFFNPILQVVIPKAKESGVKFEHNVTADLPKAMIDKRLTRMTIENLLTNAIKYTPKDGTVKLNLEFKNDEMLCTVSDTGFGIPLAEQSKIFGKLYRASNVRNTVDGNGFGLYVAKGAIESQGGKLWFESTEGKGTTFYATLPLK